MSIFVWLFLIIGMLTLGAIGGFLAVKRNQTCPTKVCANCPDWKKPECPPATTAKAPKNDTDADFEVCAVENSTCKAPVGTPIFYGVGNAYAKKEATQPDTVCSPAFFGGDPWPGRSKACWIPKGYPVTSTALESDPTFTKCASAGASCLVGSGTSIYYGSGGTYAKKVAMSSSTPCTSTFFGRSAIGPHDACFVRKGTSQK